MEFPSGEGPGGAGGLVFSGEHSVLMSAGESGRVVRIDLTSGEPGRTFDLNRNGYSGSFAGELAIDSSRDILYVADLAHFRVAAFDTRSRQEVASVAVGGPPLALTLSPDRRTLYIALGRSVVGAPASEGRKALTSGAIAVADVTQLSDAKVAAVVGGFSATGPSGVVATGNRVFVSDAARDTITAIDARSNQIESEIQIRMPGFDSLRGVLPAGLAVDEQSGWLLVAEAGINAVGVIGTRTLDVLGHLPAGAMPARVLVDRNTVYVANLHGLGAAVNTRFSGPGGSLSVYPLPAAGSLPASTSFVLQAGGFVTHPGAAEPLPGAIRHVVMIVKNGRSFDEVLGDVTEASNGPVMGAPALARFGRDGYVDGLGKRLSLHHLDVTPNHHAVAARWAFSDNFYADSASSAEGIGWLSVFRHLARHGISFLRLGGEFDPDVSDTERAGRFIQEIDRQFTRGGRDLPEFLWIRLPNDRMGPPRPEIGFRYKESYLADNDLAVGRLLEYLSGTPWWSSMAVFVTEASAESGLDHIDSRRTLLLCAGPWARQNYVSHTNTSFPGLLRTIFRLLKAPPLTLFDATAAEVSDCFAPRADRAPYRAVAVDPRVYDPAFRRDSVGGPVGAP